MPETLQTLLANIPDSWHNTTFPNDARFVGRQAFMTEMKALIEGTSTKTLEQLGHLYPEDYLRLGSPLSTLLEVQRALELKLDPYAVFNFASKTLPLIVLLFSSPNAPVYVYGPRILDDAQSALLTSAAYNSKLQYVDGPVKAHADGLVVKIQGEETTFPADADAVVSTDGFLYILNQSKVQIDDSKDAQGERVYGIHTFRKRLGAPIPTPDAIKLLNGQEVDTKVPDITEFQTHLKVMGGLDQNATGVPLVSTVGLAALEACVGACLEVGNGNINSVMCSTAYGGSSQQTDILAKRATALDKQTFDIQGKEGDVLQSVIAKLKLIATQPKKDLTLIQLEYPTNPDMKHCDLQALSPAIKEFNTKTGTKVVLLLDTTFSPASAPAKLLDPEVPLLVFNSLSKSVSGGMTTGGSVVANAHPLAQQLLERAHAHLGVFGTAAKTCQYEIFNSRHAEVELRVQNAHNNAAEAAAHIEAGVLKYSGQEMKVNFVTAAQIRKGVLPATFSFNLPVPQHLAEDGKAIEALAQSVVDRLVEEYPTGVKPCVSFGQENSLVYVTVPATSTQGVISEADKAKQAVGGVQLVRFSFPPQMDLPGFKTSLDAALKRIYTAPTTSA